MTQTTAIFVVTDFVPMSAKTPSEKTLKEIKKAEAKALSDLAKRKKV
jgi:hypothetical protein